LFRKKTVRINIFLGGIKKSVNIGNKKTKVSGGECLSRPCNFFVGDEGGLLGSFFCHSPLHTHTHKHRPMIKPNHLQCSKLQNSQNDKGFDKQAKELGHDKKTLT
jgi:hypothetical protein